MPNPQSPIPPKAYKIPISVLVVIHTRDLQVLLLERADRPGFWQSVTGSQHEGESLLQTAQREVGEETGLIVSTQELLDWRMENEFEIFLHWRGRYAPGVTHNREHVFSLELPEPRPITVTDREHLRYVWMPCEAAAAKVFSWTNAAALRELPPRLGASTRKRVS